MHGSARFYSHGARSLPKELHVLALEQATIGSTAAMPQLIDLDSLGMSHQPGFAAANDDARLDSLARDLAALVCPPATWRDRPEVVATRAPRNTTQPALDAFGRRRLREAYSLPTARLAADLSRLATDLETEVRRARRDRWITGVMALPVN